MFPTAGSSIYFYISITWVFMYACVTDDFRDDYDQLMRMQQWRVKSVSTEAGVFA